MPPARTTSLTLLFRQPTFAFKSLPVRLSVVPLRSLRKSSRPIRYGSPKASRQSQRAKEILEPESGINFFEQDARGKSSTKRRRISNPDDDLNALGSELKDLDEKAKTLQKEIDNEKIPTQAPEEVAREVFTDEERARVQQTMIENLKTFGEMPHHIKPTTKIPQASSLFLSKLNDALDGASIDAVNDHSRKTLWRYYERGKIYVPGLLEMLPDEAWKLLWTSQSEEVMDNPNRAAHLKTLTEDMAKAGKTLTEEQRFARLEGLFWDGKQDEALRQWEMGLESGDARNTEFLEMGIRMYAYDRNIQRATELADVLFKLHPKANPRILLQIISSAVGAGTEDSHESAWNIYLDFRKRVNPEITMEEYDSISLDFLRAGKKDQALAVFRDMMLAGELKKSKSGIQVVLKRLTSFMTTSDNADEVNAINLDSLSFLPRRYQNKFFYASWMKKLIGMEELDAAAQVLDLMYERGIKPDAKHVNGIISARLRGSYKPNHQKAEELGWAMVQARADFVRKRNQQVSRPSQGSAVSVHAAESDASIPASDRPRLPRTDKTRRVPEATIETFCILVQHYLRRMMFPNVRHLRNLLVDCEIPMNSYFMNHLLYAEARNRTHREVWARFQVMSRTVTPDFETFTCLWEAMKAHVNPATNPHQYRRPGEFPMPRTLLKMMLDWFQGLKGQQRRDATTDMNIETYDDILRCFCLVRDPAGTFVAVHRLKEVFGLVPEPTTTRMLILQIAKLSTRKSKRALRAHGLEEKQVNEELIGQTTEVLDMITQLRERAYTQLGYRMEDMSVEQMKEEQYRCVLQLMYTVVKQVKARNAEDDVDATAIIADVAGEMGFGKVDVEEAMSLVV